MDISVIIPLLNEVESLPELHSCIMRVMEANKYTYEVIFVDDGSTDDSWQWIEEASKKHSKVKGIKFRRNYGKSAALHIGFGASRGDVVITMDADLQDNPYEIPELFNMIEKDGYDLVSGWKKKRYDPLSKRLPSKLYNKAAGIITGIKLHDFNCGLKAYKKDVVKNIEIYGEMHRYIPYLAKQSGFLKIGEKVVKHSPRKYGTTKFGLSRFIYGYLDLISIFFISKFGKRPMHPFGTLGSLMFAIGFISAAWLGVNKIYCNAKDIVAEKVTLSPYFYLSLTFMIIGTQLFLTGFISELISRNSIDRNSYKIDKEV